MMPVPWNVWLGGAMRDPSRQCKMRGASTESGVYRYGKRRVRQLRGCEGRLPRERRKLHYFGDNRESKTSAARLFGYTSSSKGKLRKLVALRCRRGDRPSSACPSGAAPSRPSGRAVSLSTFRTHFFFWRGCSPLVWGPAQRLSSTATT